MWKWVCCALLTAAVAQGTTVEGAAAQTATAPPDCNASFDPYAYTPSALSFCGIKTYPRQDVQQLPGGGSAYDYDVNGAHLRYYVPPAGFDPLTASAGDLSEYGFPPRPNDDAALTRWLGMMMNLRPVVPPEFLAYLPNVRADSLDSSNWAGYAISGSADTFTHAEAWWDEPTYLGSQCSTTAAAIFAGVGGWGLGGLGQDGTAHGVPRLGDHQAWSAVLPDENGLIPQALYASVGDEFDASARWDGSYWHFYMYNYGTGQVLSYDDSTFDYVGDSAEAIVERPTVNGTLANLSNFGTLTFVASRANGQGLNTYSPTGGRHGVHMVGNSGDDLADPSTIGADGSFSVTQNKCF